MAPRKSILVVGAGNMGGAIVRALARQRSWQVSFFDVDAGKSRVLAKATGLKALPSLFDGLSRAEVVLLAIKPQSLGDFLATAAGRFRPGQCVITILAGVKTAALAARIPARVRLVRAMPNTPALVGAGMTAVAGKNRNDVALAKAVFSTMGKVVVVKEKMLDAVTALSGAGPAYVFRFMESFMAAARRQGFPPLLAGTLVTETMKGALSLLSSTGETPAALRIKVTSPGGVTEAALKKMATLGFERSLSEGVAAGVRRGRELNP